MDAEQIIQELLDLIDELEAPFKEGTSNSYDEGRKSALDDVRKFLINEYEK